MPFVDSHCHLNFDLFSHDLEQVLERAWQAGIDRILIPGINLETSRQVIEIAQNDPRLFAAVGVHPNDARSWNRTTLDQLRQLASHPKVIAIGEIGLDYYRDRAPRNIQKDILLEQLELASILEKPILIHSRDAYHDLWPILQSWQEGIYAHGSRLGNRCGVLHSFDGSLAVATEAIQRNFGIGISGPVTFPKSLERQSLVASLPLESLLLETDAPFLAPQPVRGRRNEPANIPMIATKIAELKSLPIEEVAVITTRNADRLFHWRRDH